MINIVYGNGYRTHEWVSKVEAARLLCDNTKDPISALRKRINRRTLTTALSMSTNELLVQLP